MAEEWKVPEEYASRIPSGEYKGISSKLILEREAVVIVRGGAVPKSMRRIPYGKIKAVKLLHTNNYINSEYLLIQGEEDDNLPLQKSHQWAAHPSVITFTCLTIVFFQLFHLLKLLTPPDTDFESIHGGKPVDIPVDLAPYFERYNPCRGEAASRLKKALGMSMRAVTSCIDRYFDVRQQALYAEDPEAIFRDLDRAIRKVTPEKEDFEKKWMELRDSGKTFCPNCLSLDFGIGKRGFNFRKSAIYGRIAPGAGLLAGFDGAEDVMFVCRKCGHKWEIK